ncbi:hypothetical protein ACFOSC_04675 [Streptantibioticus rubrisoli]|uniref:Lipoprotein n=1 Tax=Streptantibioticus rubrisoli TaxID=1387313 RepID=A0ABT1PE57_9ACTN|nr:hypothetical protein [Streptantibioticus rubrisoli]MCQ4043660.1 hypothetical protein [Streptantibioticus rubrisoli]
MPLSKTPQARRGPRRRAVLTGGLAVPLAALAGCSGNAHGAPADPAAELSARAARDSAALLARYDATATAHPALAGRLGPLRAQVALHIAAFTPASGSPSPAPSASGAPVPADQNAALAALADAELRTADARTAALSDAPPELARLLASVAAAGACHAALLRGGGAG